jgi:hypothetical protein
MYISAISILLLLAAAMPISCSWSPEVPGIVQVWQGDRMVGSGVVVGDGTQVLAV